MSRNQPLAKLNGRADWDVCNAFWVQALANHYHSEVIIGMDDRDRIAKAHFNAAFHFLPDGQSISRTEKQILVPISEYVPLKKWRWFSRFLSRQFGIGDSFQPGKEGKLFSGRISMGVSICYEETFSEVVRHLRMKNAQMLVNISNDVWFPHSRLARQHFDHGMVRAVENGLPLLRACNTGITCAVDCLGRSLASLSENKAGALFVEAPLKTFPTLYSLLGDKAILILSALFAINLLLPEIKRVD
jgi:apolipoprotein N-acyltransferase